MTESRIYTYNEMQRMIGAVYGTDSDVWSWITHTEKTGQYFGAIDEELANIGVEVVTSKGEPGRVLGYRQKVTLKTPASTGGISTGNSNYQASEYGNTRSVTTSATATKTTVGDTTTTTFQQGAKSVSTGQRVATVGMTALNTIAVVGLASRLGKAVNDSFYDSGASWAFSDEDWNDLYWRSDGLGKFFLNTLYGVDGDNGTMYMDEEALAQAYMMLREMGVYNESSYETDQSTVDNKYLDHPNTTYHVNVGRTAIVMTDASSTHIRYDLQGEGYLIAWSNTSASGSGSFVACSLSPNTTILETNLDTGNTTSFSVNDYSTTRHGVTVYYRTLSYGFRNSTQSEVTPARSYYDSGTGSGSERDAYYIALLGTTALPTVDGIENDDQATTYIDPSLIDGQDRDTVLQQLQTNYPELFDGAIYQDVPQKDGTMDRRRYIPTPIPNILNQDRPVTGANHQNNPSVNPQTNTETLLEKIIDLISNPTIPDEVPDTGEGNTPTTVIPVGSASSLWKIYNPTQAQVDAFGAWLWDSSFVEQIKKLFNDPMQAIIGIHKVFATPSTGGTATIKVGYLDSQVSSAWVDNQYTTVNCGSASLREYFGNVFDYAPYTKVQLYLPFIGIVDLDVADVMRSTISVVYHVDVLTGACLADVKVNRDGVGGVLYQYAGSAIVTYPVSAGNYMGMLAGVLSVAGGVAGSILSGGALAPALIGGAVGASHLHTDVAHSGGFSGCAGAMGSKKPYLIVSRPQTAMADNYEHYTGIPANSKVTLGNCDGYAKVKSVYVNSITRATEEEKAMIEAQLKAGVLV